MTALSIPTSVGGKSAEKSLESVLLQTYGNSDRRITFRRSVSLRRSAQILNARVGEIFRLLRRDDGLSRTAVARLARLTASDVAAVEEGKSVPIYKIDLLGWGLGVDYRTILILADVETRAAGLRPSNKPSKSRKRA